jgi:hypothetical protein
VAIGPTNRDNVTGVTSLTDLSTANANLNDPRRSVDSKLLQSEAPIIFKVTQASK